MGMRASCSFLSSRNAFKCQEDCVSCDFAALFLLLAISARGAPVCRITACSKQAFTNRLVWGGLSPPADITRKGPGTILGPALSTSQDGDPGPLRWDPLISATSTTVTEAAREGSDVSAHPELLGHGKEAPPAEFSILLLILLPMAGGSGAALLPVIALSGGD